MSYEPIIRGQAFRFTLALTDQSVPGSYKSTPTLAAGDVQVDQDEGGFHNLATLPTAVGRRVLVQLSAAEMDGDIVTVQFVDQTNPKEWGDVMITLLTTAAGVTVQVNNDKDGYSLAPGGLNAILPTEPSAKPTTFVGWIMWLIQVFRASSLTSSVFTVKTEAGATVTTQAVSDNGTVQEIGPPT